MATRTIARGLAVGIFATLCVVPSAAVAIHHLWPSRLPTNELLTDPVRWPARFDRTFTEQFERWLTDRVRRTLPALSVNAAYQVGLLRQSSDRRIVLARSGWLFFTDSGDTEPATMANFRGDLRFTDAQVLAVQTHLLAMQEVLSSCGIRSLVAVAPNKQSIYGEELSGNGQTAETELDDLLSRLDSRARSLLLDLRPPLRAAKARERDLPLYYKADTHWNALGAYYGYSAIMARLASSAPIANLQLTSRDRYRTAVWPRSGPGDMASMLAAGRWLPDDEVEVRPTFVATAPAEAGRLLIFGDSFAAGLMRYFKPHFSAAQFRRFTNSSPPLSEKPAVVVHEIIERFLITLTWSFDWSQFCTH